jgi:surfeit locus 1 family protein
MGKTRQDLPRVELTDDEAVRVSGRLSAPPQTGWRIGPPASPGDESWPRVVQYLDLAWIRSALGVQVLDQMLLLDPQEPFGFRREWTPVAFGPERHLGYALQWFSLAVAVALTYLWLSLRPADRSRDGEEDGDAR